jgi:hypothetical protein
MAARDLSRAAWAAASSYYDSARERRRERDRARRRTGLALGAGVALGLGGRLVVRRLRRLDLESVARDLEGKLATGR